MSIKIYNTLTRQKELFTPHDERSVRMYVCGPTVYDRAHIGNARAVVVFDLLFRLLRLQYGEKHVNYARNITDVDDKIINAATTNGESISELTERTTRFFHEDMGALNCLPPTVEPRATGHIPEMLAMIEKLINQGFAYEAEGHVLFAVNECGSYGELSRRSRDEMIAGARVEVAPYKKNPGDFVLWKPATENEQGFDSKFGRGRPGWHIECSAMSSKYLGENFDIHGGGADLMFPHHENEIAQSKCAAKGSSFARYWVHNGFLTVNGEKMSKSLGNFITVRDLLDKRIPGCAIKIALLSTHYRKPLDYNEKLISDSIKLCEKLATITDDYYKSYDSDMICVDTYRDYEEAHRIFIERDFGNKNVSAFIEPFVNEFVEHLENDLNTALAISVLHKIASEFLTSKFENAFHYFGLKLALIKVLGVIGVDLSELHKSAKSPSESEIPPALAELIEKRKAAKQAKNFAEADSIRKQITELGFEITDKPSGIVDWKVIT